MRNLRKQPVPKQPFLNWRSKPRGKSPSDAGFATARRLQTVLAVRIQLFAFISLAATLLFGCSGSSAPVALIVSPATIVGGPGQLVPVRVYARSGDGALQEVTAQSTLATSDSKVAAIEAGGVRVNVAGDAALIVKASGLAAWTRIQAIDGADIGALTLQPSNLTVAQSHTLQLVVSGTAPDGSALDLTGAAHFTVDDPRVASLLADGAGRIYGIAPGSVNVTATVMGKSATTALQVVPYDSTRKLASVEMMPSSVQTRIGRPAQLYAAARYDDGTVEDATTRAGWHSDGGAVDRIVAGTLLPVRGGTSRVTANVESMSASATASVVDVIEAEMRPSLMSLPIGATQPLAFVAHFTDGLVYDFTAAADWTSEDDSLARVDGGSVAGVADGMTAVHAVAFGRTAVAAITVGNGGATDGGLPMGVTVVGLAVTPPFATIGLGSAQAFSATATFSDGTQQTLGGGVTWLAGPGATIDGSGVATSSTAGTYGISADYGGQHAAATLTVTANVAHPTSVSVTPAAVALSAGDTRTLVATAQYDDGSTRDVTAMVQWTSSSAAATIAAGGHLTAHQNGSATITAQLGTLSATSQVTVSPALTGVTVYPTFGASVVSGTSVALTATANYSDGSMVDITHSAGWTTANSAIVTVSMGTATGHAIGSTQISASYGGQWGQTTVTVTAPKVTSLSITGTTTVTCYTGNYYYYTATATMSDGTQRDVSTSTSSPQVTWQLNGLTGYPGLYASQYSDELYCSSTCATTCTIHYGYGSITAYALNDDNTTVTSNTLSITAAYRY